MDTPKSKPVEPQDRTPEQIADDIRLLRQIRAQNMARYGWRVGSTDLLLAEVREEG